MGMDIDETGNAGTKDETRGTGMNGGVLEMQQKRYSRGRWSGADLLEIHW